MDQAKNTTGIERIEPWPMGDHMVFAMAGIPAIAITASNIFNLLGTLTHTPSDDMHNIDLAVLDNITHFLERIINQ
jgi:Iap family predicted aminopeptidase